MVYAASAFIFRQAYWLYLSNALVPVIALLVLHYNEVLTAPWVSGIFMGLAFVYLGVGQIFTMNPPLSPLLKGGERAGSPLGNGGGRGVAPFALPFLAPSYLLSAAALAVASGDKFLALEIYPAGVVLYALSAWVFRESLFLYPAAWLVAVPYYLGMTLTSLPTQWYGLGWLPLIVAYIVIARFVFEASARTNISPTHPAIPFYILAYGLSVSMVIASLGNYTTLTFASTAAAIIYFSSAALFRRAVWLYPGLLSAHLAFAAFLATFASDRPWYFLSVPFLGMTWLVALIGYAFSKFALRFRSATSKPTGDRSTTPVPTTITPPPTIKSPWLGALGTWSWAQPFIAIATLDVILWQIVALNGLDTAIIVASGNLALLALFATMWQDAPLAYGAVAFFLLALSRRFEQVGLPFAEALAWIGGAGFGMYLLARAAEQISFRMRTARFLTVWPPALTNAALGLTTLAAVATLPTVPTRMTASAAALGFAGALYLTTAYRRRNYGLGYLGMALLEAAWALILLDRKIAEPQVYAIPAGLYLAGVGFLERRQASVSNIPARKTFANFIESFGLVVLLLTSFVQSLNGTGGFPYFLLLILEALLVVWWGAARRIKVPFFIGLAASALNVVAQVVVMVNVYNVNQFFVFLGVGLLLVTLAVFVERQRAQIFARSQKWLEVLETWT